MPVVPLAIGFFTLVIILVVVAVLLLMLAAKGFPKVASKGGSGEAEAEQSITGAGAEGGDVGKGGADVQG